MRQFKFRAWNKELKKMIPFKDLHVELEDGEYTIGYSLEEDGIHDGLPICDFSIMQFSGLYDKNRNEIYEGDILRGKYGSLGIVKFHKTWGSFYYAMLLGLDEDKELACITSSKPFYNDSGDYEIVGNVHESSEIMTYILKMYGADSYLTRVILKDLEVDIEDYYN